MISMDGGFLGKIDVHRKASVFSHEDRGLSGMVIYSGWFEHWVYHIVFQYLNGWNWNSHMLMILSVEVYIQLQLGVIDHCSVLFARE